MKAFLVAVFVALCSFPAYARTEATYKVECFPASELTEQLADKGYIMSMIGITDYNQLGQLWVTYDGKWKWTIRQKQETCILAGGADANIYAPDFKVGVEH